MTQSVVTGMVCLKINCSMFFFFFYFMKCDLFQDKEIECILLNKQYTCLFSSRFFVSANENCSDSSVM